MVTEQLIRHFSHGKFKSSWKCFSFFLFHFYFYFHFCFSSHFHLHFHSCITRPWTILSELTTFAFSKKIFLFFYLFSFPFALQDGAYFSQFLFFFFCSMIEGLDGNSSQTRRCYITITAVPSLDNCSACYQVATSYEEDGMETLLFFLYVSR